MWKFFKTAVFHPKHLLFWPATLQHLPQFNPPLKEHKKPNKRCLYKKHGRFPIIPSNNPPRMERRRLRNQNKKIHIRTRLRTRTNQKRHRKLRKRKQKINSPLLPN